MAWEHIGETDREALIEWFNQVPEPDPDIVELPIQDRERLAKLFEDGKFRHWHCPECNEMVLVGNPDDWDHFYGAHQSECIGELCADCGVVYLRLKIYADE